MILKSQPSSCVSRMTAAAKYSPQCLAQRPTTRIELICIWTFKSERRRSANRSSCTTCASDCLSADISKGRDRGLTGPPNWRTENSGPRDDSILQTSLSAAAVPNLVGLTRGYFAIIVDGKISLQKQRTSWRRGWDSNPRYGYPYNGFRDRPIRPLWHLSVRRSCSLLPGARQPEGPEILGLRQGRDRLLQGKLAIDLSALPSILRRFKAICGSVRAPEAPVFQAQNSDG